MTKVLHFTLRVEADYDTDEGAIKDMVQDVIDSVRAGVSDAVRSIEVELVPDEERDSGA